MLDHNTRHRCLKLLMDERFKRPMLIVMWLPIAQFSSCLPLYYTYL